jgi:hypothetical protein
MRYHRSRERMTASTACFVISAVASLLTLVMQMALYFIAPGGILLEIESFVVRNISGYWLVMAIFCGAIAVTWAIGFCLLLHTWWILRRVKRAEVAGALLTPVVVVAGAMLFSFLANYIPPLSISIG